MAGPLYGTEYVAHALTFVRGTVADVTHVGIYWNINPNASPDADVVSGGMAGDFTVVSLIDGTEDPKPALAEGSLIDVLALIGPKAGADFDIVTPGNYQLWILIGTATEDIIRKTGVLEVV